MRDLSENLTLVGPTTTLAPLLRLPTPELSILAAVLCGDVLSIEVLRFDTGEMLEGKLNSYRLEPKASAGTTP